MAKPFGSDERWEVVAPLLPPQPPKPTGGPPRVDGHAALIGIRFVFGSCPPSEMLPQELGCGRGMTRGR
jgi:transposase